MFTHIYLLSSYFDNHYNVCSNLFAREIMLVSEEHVERFFLLYVIHLSVANQAANIIEEESAFLRLAMGHQEATVDDYSESRDALLEDMMYFPSRQVYNLASVASMTDRLSAFQSEFDIVKKHMEGETKK